MHRRPRLRNHHHNDHDHIHVHDDALRANHVHRLKLWPDARWMRRRDRVPVQHLYVHLRQRIYQFHPS